MKHVSFLLTVLAASVLVLAMPAAVLSAPPSNDNFANATAVTSLPFSGTVDINEATTEAGEPIANPGQIGRTVWFSLTPTDDQVVSTAPPIIPPGPEPPSLCSLRSIQFLVVYRADGTGFAGLNPIAGSQWSNAMANTLQLHAGATYYFQGGQNGGLFETGCPAFNLSLSAVLPPPDNTPPVITTPENVSVPATSPQGATVSYDASATDLVDGSVPVACSPLAGSMFAIGTTSVTCTAADAHSNRATASFNVHVEDGSEQLVDLELSVSGLGPGTSLTDKASSAQTALATGDRLRACEILNAFTNQIAALAGKTIPAATAERLIIDASRIRTVLGH